MSEIEIVIRVPRLARRRGLSRTKAHAFFLSSFFVNNTAVRLFLRHLDLFQFDLFFFSEILLSTRYCTRKAGKIGRAFLGISLLACRYTARVCSRVYSSYSIAPGTRYLP